MYRTYDWLQEKDFGFGGGYKTLAIGSLNSSNTFSLAFGVDVSGNPSGAFSGYGSEYFWRSAGSFKTPNASNNGYNQLFEWNSSGQLTFNQAAEFIGTVTVGSPLSIKSTTPYIQWINASSTRLAYIQHNATNLIYNADTGVHVFNQSATVTSSLYVKSSAYPNIYYTSLRSDGSAVGILQLGNNNDNYILGGNNAAGGYLIFRVNVTSESITSGVESLRLNSNATASFSSRVNVNGASDDADIALQTVAPSGAGKYIYVGRDSSAQWRFSVSSSGDTQIGAPQAGAVYKLLTLSSSGNDLDNGTVLRLIGNSALDLVDISVRDTTTRIYHQENAADAANGYGKIQFRTNATANGSFPTRGGFQFTIGSTDALFIDSLGQAAFSSSVSATTLSLATSGATRLTLSGTDNGIILNDTTAISSARNWGIFTSSAVEGDFVIRVGSSQGAAPSSNVLYFTATGTATFSNLAGSGSRIVVADASGTLSATSALSGYVTGSGTTNYIPKWTSGSAIGNSSISDNGSGRVSIGTTSFLDSFVISNAGTTGWEFGNSGTVITYNRSTSSYIPMTFQASSFGFTGAATFSSSVADYGATITNIQDSSQGLLVRATDNDSSLYLLNLQSSNTATGQTWVDRFTVAKNGAATFTTTTTLGITIVTNDVTTLKMNSTGGTKNWGFATTNLAASDFGIYQSNTGGGDPISAGAAKLYFNGTGAATFSSSITVGTNVALTPSGFGYDPNSYRTLIVGPTGNSIFRTLTFGVDVSGNPSGAFSGSGSEYVWRNTATFITPNAINNGYNTLLSWNSSGQFSFYQLGYFLSNLQVNGAFQIGDYTQGTNNLTFAASANGIAKINFYDSNNTEGLYIRTDGEQYGGTMTFGARWDDDESKIVFKMYQVSAGAAYNQRVGIGIVNPQADLHVFNSGSSAAITTGLKVNHECNADDFVVFFTGNESNASNRFVMTQPGRIGIGTPAPNSTLQVIGDNGSSASAIVRLRDTNSTARTTRLQFEDYSSTLADGIIDFRIGTAGVASSATLSIGVNGAGLTFSNTNAATFNNTVQATNIGIGNAPTGTKLFANQDTSGEWIATFKNYGGSASYGVSIDMSGSTSVQSAFQVYTPVGNGIRVLNSNGGLLVGTFTDISGKLVVKQPYTSGTTPIYLGNTSFTAWNRQAYDTFVLQQDDVTSFRMVEKNGESTGSDQVLTFSIGDGLGVIATSAQPLGFYVNGSPSGVAYQGLSGTQVLRLQTNGSANFYGALTIAGTVSTTGNYVASNSGIAEIRLQGGGYGGSYNTSLRSIVGAPGVLQFGNNGGNYILAGNTNVGGLLEFRVNCNSESISSGSKALTLNANATAVFESTVTATNFITTSDRRLKTEIKEIKNAISILSKFASYEYVKDGKQDAGFIAQEVKEAIPYSVFENNDGILTMSDRPILAYIHKAILELNERIIKLEK